MKNLKKLTRENLKCINGGNVPSEGFACFCGSNFRGYVFTVEACEYTCAYRP